MSKYQQYPEYKDSGIDWLKEIPSHWSHSKLRYLFTFGKGLSITKENLQDNGIPCVNYGEVHSKYGFEVTPERHHLKCVDNEYLNTSANALLSKGDFVFADTSEDLEGSGNFTQLISDHQVFAGYHTVIARPSDAENSRFFAYLFDSQEFRAQIRFAVKGVKVFSITQGILRALYIWLPPAAERLQIRAFLDHELAIIDRLINKQQKLVILLKEKLLAAVSHAVTIGLNSDSPMKDSGVEWLGRIPEHWEVKRVASLYRERVESGNAELPVLTVSIHTGISNKELSAEESDRKINRIEDKTKYKRVYANDLSYNMMRAWQGGFGASEVDGLVSPAYVVAVPLSDLPSTYFEAVGVCQDSCPEN